MATVASLLVKIGADTSDLRKELNATKRQINSAFGSDFMSVSNKAAAGLVGIGVALAGVAVAAVKTAAGYQRTSIALTNMLGSAEKANAFLKEMQTFAAKTPFSFTDVAQASQKFLAFGFTAEQILPTLTAVGDAAAGVGAGSDGVNRLTVALGQIAAKGKLASQEMMQITELGIPAWQLLAEAMGTSVAEAQDQVTKGAVSSQVALEALVNGMESRYAGLMDQQSKGIEGAWSSMMDGLEQSAAQVGLKISEALSLPDVFSGLGNALSDFAAAVETSGIATAFATMVPPGVQIAIVAIGTALVAVAIPAIALAATSLAAFAAPLIAAIAAFAPFIAGAVAIATSLYALYASGVTVADVLSFLGVNTTALTGLWDTFRATAQSVGNAVVDYLGAMEPAFTAFLAVGTLAFMGIGQLIGWVIDLFVSFATAILLAIGFVADGLAEWFDFLGGIFNGIGDVFMDMANSVLPDWANNGLKTISGFVEKAISWLSQLIGAVNDTNTALGSTGGGGTTTEKEPPKTKKWTAPTFSQFGGMDTDGGGKTAKGSKGKADTTAKDAERTSKSIEDAWYQTFATKTALIDRWYQEELAELNKSASANANYERDKQRLVELYGQKRLDALQAEAQKAREIQNSARDTAFSARENTMKLGGSDSQQAYQQMFLEYEKGISSIDDRWAQLSQNYLGYTVKEKEAFLSALTERGIAYEVNANNELEFEKQLNAEKLALAKGYYDQIAEYHANCADIKKDIDEAYRTYDMQRLQEVLTEQAAMRLNDMEAQKEMMEVYQEAFLASHQTTAQLVADMYSAAFSGLSTAFTDILSFSKSAKEAFADLGKAMLKTIAQYFAQQLAGMLVTAAMGKSIGQQQTADSIARASAELAAWTPAAVAYAVLHPSAPATALAAVTGALTGAVGLATAISSTFSGVGSTQSGTNWSGAGMSMSEQTLGAMGVSVGIPKYASGGLFTRPMLGILGDGAEDEVALPLSQSVFQSIANGIVSASRDGGNGGSSAVFNNYGDINTNTDLSEMWENFSQVISSGRRGA